MKGNQGLEALAALCGDQSKVLASTESSSDAANGLNTTNSNTNATAFVGKAQRTTAKLRSSPDSIAVPGMVTSMTKTTSSLPSANTGINANTMNNNNPFGQLTAQQLITAATNNLRPGGGNGMIDPIMAQSLLISAGLMNNQPQQHSAQTQAQIQKAVEAATTSPPAASSSSQQAVTFGTLAIQQYVQAQAAAQAKVQQQQAQAAQAAAHAQVAAAAAAMLSSNPQAALFATMASLAQAGNIGGIGGGSSIGSIPASNNKSTIMGLQQRQQLPSHTHNAATSKTETTLQVPSDSSNNSKNVRGSSSPLSSTSYNPATVNAAQSIQQQYGGFSSNSPPLASNSLLATTTTNSNNVVAPSAASAAASLMKVASNAGGGRTISATAAESAVAASLIMNSNKRKIDTTTSNKKQQKRAANRRSAQLSRKRKKQFIEELKEENDDLRRKEQILKAIPDLVVVFDSSGKLGFVSQSVGRFLDVSPKELEGTSFWNMICEESVRLLKAAFMDSLAARDPESDTALLGSGVWELRLKDKHSKYIVVTLNGVVHFKGESPEVVCCIRPLSEQQQQQPTPQISSQESQQQPSSPHQSSSKLQTGGINSVGGANIDNNKAMNRSISCSDGDASRISDESNGTQQSVLGEGRHNISLSSQAQEEASSSSLSEEKKRNKKYRRMMHHHEQKEVDNDDHSSSNNNGGEADGTNNSIRISDGESLDGLESDRSTTA